MDAFSKAWPLVQGIRGPGRDQQMRSVFRAGTSGSSGLSRWNLVREEESSSQSVMEDAEVFCCRWNYLLDG